MVSVLQDWMNGLTYCQQSTVLSASRKPDFVDNSILNKAVRWIRFVSQKDGMDSEFMRDTKLGLNKELTEALKTCSLDYAIHFLHALEIIGYEHPHSHISEEALRVYSGIVHQLHLRPETIVAMKERLKGKEMIA